jgi:pyridoxine 4-dehydrogenase
VTHSEVESPDLVLAACESRGIAFLPFFPLGVGGLTKPGGALATAAERHRATPAQIAIAWLLARSPVVLPIPGTSRPEHVEENWAARNIVLTQDEVREIGAAARAT